MMHSARGPQTIFLARHGQSISNIEERISGQTDPPLTLKGERQAQRLAEAMHGIRLTKVITSSLRRSIETARPTAESLGIPMCSVKAFNEMSFGMLDGQLRGGLNHEQQQLLDQWAKDKVEFRVPNGECLMDVQQRVVPVLSRVLADMADGTLLIVGHRHTNLVILSALLRCDLHAIADSPIQSKYVYEIQYAPTPHIHTICLTGKARGKKIEGFLSGDDAMRSAEEHCLKS